MPAVVDTEADDCEWVIERSKAFLRKKDHHGARAWMLTARSLFPYRFIVQYEAFCLYVLCEELTTAAHTLTELCAKFPKEAKLQELAGKLCESLSPSREQGQEEGTEERGLKAVFELLPPQSRKMVLLKLSEGACDPLHQGRIALVALRLFPELATTLGLDCYDALSQSVSHSSLPAIDNPHRELLVTKLIPLLASSTTISLDQPILRTSGQTTVLKTSHICQWLEVAASYHTSVIVQSLMQGKAHHCAGKRGWESLHKLFLMVCERCMWMEVVHNKQTQPHLPPKLRWIGLEHISGYSTTLRVPFEAPRPVAIACFYISVFLFFECVWNYFCHTFQPQDGGGVNCWALVEDRQSRNEAGESRPPAKKRKVAEETEKPLLNLQAGSRPADQNVYESFLVAIDCWGFIHSSTTYRGEFTRLCQQWGANEWAWLTAFRADMTLYKGDLELVKKLLTQYKLRMKAQDREKPENLRVLVQLVNCNVLSGDTKTACALATELIALLPDSSSPSTSSSSSSISSSSSTLSVKSATGRVPRVLKLVSIGTSEVFSYTIDIITSAVKEVALADTATDDALGQLMVLCQYQWPREKETLSSIMAAIQKRGSFSYPHFLTYIISVDVLEEIMFLINHTSVQLCLLPQETSSRSRTVTRGVNSRAKEELVAAVEQQLERCEEPLELILKTFFKQEKLCFTAGSST